MALQANLFILHERSKVQPSTELNLRRPQGDISRRKFVDHNDFNWRWYFNTTMATSMILLLRKRVMRTSCLTMLATCIAYDFVTMTGTCTCCRVPGSQWRQLSGVTLYDNDGGVGDSSSRAEDIRGGKHSADYANLCTLLKRLQKIRSFIVSAEDHITWGVGILLPTLLRPAASYFIGPMMSSSSVWC